MVFGKVEGTDQSAGATASNSAVGVSREGLIVIHSSHSAFLLHQDEEDDSEGSDSDDGEDNDEDEDDDMSEGGSEVFSDSEASDSEDEDAEVPTAAQHGAYAFTL